MLAFGSLSQCQADPEELATGGPSNNGLQHSIAEKEQSSP